MTGDGEYIAWLVSQQRGVVARAQLPFVGVTESGLRHRVRPGGAWQRLLPGIYLTSTGEPTQEQLAIGALLFAGPKSLITGPAALRLHRILGPRTAKVDVLVPASRKRASWGYVVIHRTRRMPPLWASDFPLGYALPARAVADTVRGLTELANARSVVASAVQRRRCTLEQLSEELRAGHRTDGRLLRQVLAEVAVGIRSPAEGDLRELISTSDLPDPLYNPDLFLNGEFLARPDAWWPQAGVAVEVDSVQWHALPADYAKTLRRGRKMTAAGILVVHVTPHQLRAEPREVLRDIAGALKSGRPVPGITARPATA
jgi:hypothetical protein